jgi:predicted transcriptional regulator
MIISPNKNIPVTAGRSSALAKRSSIAKGNIMNNTEGLDAETLITLTSDIVAAHVSNNNVRTEDVAPLITLVHQALSGLGGCESSEQPRPDPAVSIRSSVKKDHLVCLEDGKKMKMLKRHLMTEHGMTPDEYRQRWGLGSDYPMVASDYAETRRELAKKIGLGRKPGQQRGRRKKS